MISESTSALSLLTSVLPEVLKIVQGLQRDTRPLLKHVTRQREADELVRKMDFLDPNRDTKSCVKEIFRLEDRDTFLGKVWEQSKKRPLGESCQERAREYFVLLAKKLSPELPEQIQEHPLVSAWTARMGAALLKRFKSCQKKIYQNRLAHIFDELYTAYYESGDAVLLVENQDDLVVQILDGLHLPDISMVRLAP